MIWLMKMVCPISANHLTVAMSNACAVRAVLRARPSVSWFCMSCVRISLLSVAL
jgi:hypothetical protein